MGDDSRDDSSTEERIDRLESVVKAQNETIREMLPGRRAVLAGGAAAALGFGAGSGSASGQSAAGQVGTESEPVDVEAASVNAGSVNTEKGEITNPDTNRDAPFPLRSPLKIQGGTDAEDGITLMGTSNTINRESKAPIWWYDAKGNITLFNIVAHHNTNNGHDHWSWYAWHGDGGDTDRDKVFDLNYNLGQGLSTAEYQELEHWMLEPTVDEAIFGDFTGSVGVERRGGPNDLLNTTQWRQDTTGDGSPDAEFVTGVNPNQTGADVPAYAIADGTSIGAGFYFACIPSEDEIRVYRDINAFGTLLADLNVGAQPSPGDLEGREIGFTADRDGTGTAAWLYNDGSSVHFWDADGTL